MYGIINSIILSTFPMWLLRVIFMNEWVELLASSRSLKLCCCYSCLCIPSRGAPGLPHLNFLFNSTFSSVFPLSISTCILSSPIDPNTSQNILILIISQYVAKKFRILRQFWLMVIKFPALWHFLIGHLWSLFDLNGLFHGLLSYYPRFLQSWFISWLFKKGFLTFLLNFKSFFTDL